MAAISQIGGPTGAGQSPPAQGRDKAPTKVGDVLKPSAVSEASLRTRPGVRSCGWVRENFHRGGRHFSPTGALSIAREDVNEYTPGHLWARGRHHLFDVACLLHSVGILEHRGYHSPLGRRRLSRRSSSALRRLMALAAINRSAGVSTWEPAARTRHRPRQTRKRLLC